MSQPTPDQEDAHPNSGFSFKLPELKVPNLKVPDLKFPDVKLPHVTLPDVKFPDVKFPGIPPGPWVDWFRVDEEKLRDILQQVRSELPTTEALLIGKPQSGKSSIVRGLTGVSSDIIGPGFRPHTQHTARYAYPNEDLPLLQFVDTVGLGDGQQETQQVTQELAEILNQAQTARLIIWTVKVSDFATDSLKQIAQDLRSRYPQVPCLLAITCLHELYETQTSDHPEYPPSNGTIDRAVAQIKQDFLGLYDQVILIDFTLEEDEFSPLFYGLEALSGAIETLLPEAEARTIAQLVNDRDLTAPVGDLYRSVGRRMILPFAIAAGTCAAVPLPLATMPVLTGIQISMVTAIGKLYGRVLTPAQAGGLVSTIAGGFVAQTIGRELVKLIPGFGSVIAASWATAYTWALGEAACVYFGDLMGGKTPDSKRIQALMRDSFEAAKKRSPLAPL
jgi:uncharacterized protein (DUF697 family)/predicted GTPase